MLTLSRYSLAMVNFITLQPTLNIRQLSVQNHKENNRTTFKDIVSVCVLIIMNDYFPIGER